MPGDKEQVNRKDWEISGMQRNDKIEPGTKRAGWASVMTHAKIAPGKTIADPFLAFLAFRITDNAFSIPHQ